MLKVEWRGRAIFVVNRTPQMLAQLEGVDAELRDPGLRTSPTSPSSRRTRRAP